MISLGPPDDLPPPPPNPDDAGGSPRRKRLSLELIHVAVEALLDGAFRKDAAKAMGVTPRAFQKWFKSGQENPDGLYGLFVRSVLAAEANWRSVLMASITSGAKEDGWLALAVLERRDPRGWGKYRGELGDLKQRIKELEKLAGLAGLSGETADSAAD